MSMTTSISLRRAALAAAATLAIVLAGSTGTADAQPARIPIQGVLTDAGDNPLSGPATVEFAIYAVQSGGTPVFQETHSLALDRGVFTAYLGAVQSLDLRVFDGATLYVGIKVGNDPEMLPRLALGTVPYAAFAAECASVPTGAVMHFDLSACPSGWTELTAGRGRTLVGRPSGGLLGGTVGTALGDRATRTINQVPAHVHAVGPITATTGDGGGHTPTMQSSGAHSHTLRLSHQYNGAGNLLQVASSANDASVADTNLASSGAHTHTMNAVAAHAHPISIAQFNSAPAGVASVDVTMPYLQLVICRKN